MRVRVRIGSFFFEVIGIVTGSGVISNGKVWYREDV